MPALSSGPGIAFHYDTVSTSSLVRTAKLCGAKRNTAHRLSLACLQAERRACVANSISEAEQVYFCRGHPYWSAPLHNINGQSIMSHVFCRNAYKPASLHFHNMANSPRENCHDTGFALSASTPHMLLTKLPPARPGTASVDLSNGPGLMASDASPGLSKRHDDKTYASLEG